MPLIGGCSCGAIRYSISQEALRAFQCQCVDCRKDTGGGHSSVMVFHRAAFHVEGSVKETARVSNAGRGKTKGFCGDCGSPIYNKPDSHPDLLGIYVGSLDDASQFRPTVVLFNSRGYPWDKLDPDVPRLPEWYDTAR